MELKRINVLKTICQVFRVISIVAIVQSAIVLIVFITFIPQIKTDLGSEGLLLGFAPLLMFALGDLTFIVFFVGIYKLLFNEYKRSYKRYFAHKVLSKYLKDYKYEPKHGELASGIEGLIKSTGMVANVKNFKTEDYVVGKYKGVDFVQADFHPKGVISTPKKPDASVFYGRWLIFKFPKCFAYKAGIVGRNYGFVYGALNIGLLSKSKFKRVKVESTEFNKEFMVFAENGPEVFYLLDPSLIEKIQGLGKKYMRRIVICFSDYFLQIGINDGLDLFEPSKKLTFLDEEKESAKIDAEVQPIMDLVDSLELDKKAFA